MHAHSIQLRRMPTRARKILRKDEQERRQKWSKQHGGDPYGDSESEVVGEKPVKACKACGSKTHSHTTSKDSKIMRLHEEVAMEETGWRQCDEYTIESHWKTAG